MSDHHEMLALLRDLGADERRVLVVIARRLLAGQRHYGRLDVRRDGRDWRRERAEELADALVYTAIAEIAATLQAPRSTGKASKNTAKRRAVAGRRTGRSTEPVSPLSRRHRLKRDP